MITHEIVKHKPRWKAALDTVLGHSSNLPVIHTPQQQMRGNIGVVPIQSSDGGTPWLGKQAYAEIVKGLRMSIGAYCFFRNCDYPIPKNKIYKIVGIQEVYYLAKGNNQRDKDPKPYYLKNADGEEAFANDDLLVEYKPPSQDRW